MTPIQRFDISQLPDTAAYGKFRTNPPDKCLVSQNAHCGVWWRHTPSPDEQIGLIGHFYADRLDNCRTLMDAACAYLEDQGCRRAIGPMDGNTWKPYRFVTFSDGSAPFLMEPQNPDAWPRYWQASGFVPCHEYVSTLITHLGQPDPRVAKACTRLQNAGFLWRSIDTAEFSNELRRVYRLSAAAFKDNVLYTPIDEADFLQQYLPFADRINPEYVLIAEDEQGDCCGFIFAVPDLLQAQRGEPIDRLIIKTLAVSPGRRSAGLGAVLVDAVQTRAHRNGIDNAIHALMYSKNNSANIGKNGSVMRRYTLFERHLS